MLVRKGDKGNNVGEIQTWLNTAQGESLRTDGNFGALTEAAVKRFQAKQGLREDGIWGDNTQKAAEKLGFAIVERSPATPSHQMTISQRGLDFIKSFEREILKVYDDGYGFLTAGIGHLLTDNEKKHFKKGDPITKAQSEAWFAQDVATHAEPVNRLVKVPLTQGQYDALVSLVFNIGEGNFAKSSLLRALNSGDYEAAKVRFDDWIRSNGQVSRGLIRRRNEEQVIFDS